MNEPDINITVQTENIIKQNTKITNTKHREWILKIIKTNESCFIVLFFYSQVVSE